MKILVAVVDLCCVDFSVWVDKKPVTVKRTGEEYSGRIVVDLNLVMKLVTDV